MQIQYRICIVIEVSTENITKDLMIFCPHKGYILGWQPHRPPFTLKHALEQMLLIEQLAEAANRSCEHLPRGLTRGAWSCNSELSGWLQATLYFLFPSLWDARLQHIKLGQRTAASLIVSSCCFYSKQIDQMHSTLPATGLKDRSSSTSGNSSLDELYWHILPGKSGNLKIPSTDYCPVEPAVSHLINPQRATRRTPSAADSSESITKSSWRLCCGWDQCLHPANYRIHKAD